MPIVYIDPFKMDWTDKEKVIQFAKKLGKGQIVLKYPDRKNYNIIPASREKDLARHLQGAVVIFRT